MLYNFRFYGKKQKTGDEKMIILKVLAVIISIIFIFVFLSVSVAVGVETGLRNYFKKRGNNEVEN